ncbi:MAG: cold-shock protein [Planctomycetes bacterium]|nr:cold-shock protein [Planctomycetota bacterium]
MPNGTVKWFNDQRGYGFIIPENENTDLFVHASNIMMEGWKSLQEGQVVEYELGTGKKGLEAKKVRVVATPVDA